MHRMVTPQCSLSHRKLEQTGGPQLTHNLKAEVDRDEDARKAVVNHLNLEAPGGGVLARGGLVEGALRRPVQREARATEK